MYVYECVYVCMYVLLLDIHIYIYIYIYIYTHTHTHTYIHTHIHIHTYIHTHRNKIIYTYLGTREKEVIEIHENIWFRFYYIDGLTSGSDNKESTCKGETWVRTLGWEDPLGEGMATHSSILAWKNLMDRGTWWAMVHRAAKSWTWPNN